MRYRWGLFGLAVGLVGLAVLLLLSTPGRRGGVDGGVESTVREAYERCERLFGGGELFASLQGRATCMQREGFTFRDGEWVTAREADARQRAMDERQRAIHEAERLTSAREPQGDSVGLEIASCLADNRSLLIDAAAATSSGFGEIAAGYCGHVGYGRYQEPLAALDAETDWLAGHFWNRQRSTIDRREAAREMVDRIIRAYSTH